MAKGCNPFNSVGKWNALEQFSKRLPIGVPIEPHKEERFAMVLDNATNKSDESGEKVRFVDDDNVEAPDRLIFKVVEGLETAARNATPVVRNDVILFAVPIVTRMLDNQNALPDAHVPANDAQDAG